MIQQKSVHSSASVGETIKQNVTSVLFYGLLISGKLRL